MTDIYVTYASEDSERVGAIVGALREAGYDVWWDRDMAPGTDRATAIAGHLDAAKLVLVGWSRASADEVAGKDVIDEAEKANGRGAYLGVMLDQVKLPFGFGGHEAIEVAPFRGSSADLARIVAGVRRFMAEGQAIVAPLPPPPEVRPPGKAPLYAGIAAAVLAVGALASWAVIRARARHARSGRGAAVGGALLVAAGRSGRRWQQRAARADRRIGRSGARGRDHGPDRAREQAGGRPDHL